jgi:crotonobetainyl-CoA:carnitine CoA-transferase CaiB-like acyl-CoA transferase
VITGRNVNYPDQTVCLYGAAMVTLGALRCREDNCAMHIDVSQRDVAVYMLGETLEDIGPGGTGQVVPDIALEGVFRTADDRWVALAVESEQAAERVGLSLLSETTLSEWVAVRTTDEVERMCREHGVGATTVVVGSEMLAIRQQQPGDDTFAVSPCGDLVKGYPFQFQNVPMTIYRDAPKVGEHSDQYLAEGVTSAVGSARKRGVAIERH